MSNNVGTHDGKRLRNDSILNINVESKEEVHLDRVECSCRRWRVDEKASNEIDSDGV